MSLFKDKNGQYACRYNTWGVGPDGKPKPQRVYKTLGDMSYKEAKPLYDKLIHESHAPRSRAEILPLAAAVEAYIGRHGVGIDEHSVSSVKRFKAHYLRLLGDIPCDQVTKAKVQDYVNARLAEPSATNPRKKMSPASIKREVAFLKSILNKAVEWDLLPVNPMNGFHSEQLSYEGRANFFFEREDLTLLWKAFDGKTEERFRDFFKILFFIGCRISELINLTWWDVDFKRGLITVHLLKQKKSRDKVIPMSPEAREILERLYAAETNKTGNVFHDEAGQPIKLARLEAMFTRMMKASGIQRHLTPHALRHTFASLAVGDGASIYQVSEALGHADVKMTTEFYAHMAPTKLQGLVNMVSGPEKSANEMPTALSGENKK